MNYKKNAHKSHFATFSDSDHDERLLNESRGLSAWPGWLRDEAKAKSQLRPTRMAGLAWPTWAWLGRLFGLEPSHAQHYAA